MLWLLLSALLAPIVIADLVAHSKDMKNGKAFRILAMGDSITEGMTRYPGGGFYPYAATIMDLANASKVNNFEVVEEGVSGELVVPTMVDRLKTILSGAQAAGKEFTHVFLMGGLNDIAWGHKADDVFQGLLHMYKESEKHGAHVVGMTIMEYAAKTPNFTPLDAVRQEINALIRGHFETYGQGQGSAPGKLSLVDLEKLLTPEMVPPEGQGKSYFQDAMHLTPHGYKLMGTILYDQIIKPELAAAAATTTAQ